VNSGPYEVLDVIVTDGGDVAQCLMTQRYTGQCCYKRRRSEVWVSVERRLQLSWSELIRSPH